MNNLAFRLNINDAAYYITILFCVGEKNIIPWRAALGNISSPVSYNHYCTSLAGSVVNSMRTEIYFWKINKIEKKYNLFMLEENTTAKQML